MDFIGAISTWQGVAALVAYLGYEVWKQYRKRLDHREHLDFHRKISALEKQVCLRDNCPRRIRIKTKKTEG